MDTFRDKLAFLPRAFLLFLTAILPLKFASTAGVPEMPMIYWTEPVGILIGSWSVMLFPAFAAFALILCILLMPPPDMKNPLLRGYALLWALFAAASLSGWIHASTWDFAIQNTLHCFGLACYAMSLCLMLERDPKHFARQLFIAILTGAAFSIYSALNQYWSGFEETRKFIEEKERATGQQIMTGQFASRLMESRVSGDFAVCNVYAGYLALVFPLILAVLYRFGGRVTPPWAARLILCGGGGALYLFLLKETGSRGGILALIVGIAFTILAFRIPRRIRFFCYALIPVMLAGFVILVKMWRGFASMLFRFDYFKAAFEMMLAHPLSGAGWGEFFHEYLIYKDLINDEAPHGPHNFILAAGSQAGTGAFLISGILLLIPLAAALYLFHKASVSGDDADDRIMKCGMTLAIVSWTFHSMIELNYETPGSTATAIALGSLILVAKGADRIVSLPVPETAGKKKLCSMLFLLISAGLVLYPALKLPQAVAGEMCYERLHSSTDVRFGTPRKGNPPTPDEVMRMLQDCVRITPDSPFPYAAASSYYLTLGPFYVNESLSLLDEAIKRAPKRAGYYYRKYLILRHLPGRAAEAEQALKKAQELSPKNPEYFDRNELSHRKQRVSESQTNGESPKSYGTDRWICCDPTASACRRSTTRTKPLT